MTYESAEQFFSQLGSNSDSRATNLTASYRFDIEGAGSWTVAIADGAIEVTEGVSDADATFSASEESFEKIVAGARLVSEHTNLKRCVSIGHMSPARARALKDAGVQRVHHNVETAESYYPEVSTTVRYEGRLRTIDAVRDAGLETCVGGILNLGESNEQRVEMAFQLAEVNPTSVPINLLNPQAVVIGGETPSPSQPSRSFW